MSKAPIMTDPPRDDSDSSHPDGDGIDGFSVQRNKVAALTGRVG